MEWISVKDMLPIFGEEVIFTDGEDVTAGYTLDDTTWYDWGGNRYEVTHWMPIPKLPQED